MTWNVTAQTVRCKGRLVVGYRAGADIILRCQTILFVGSWFWLDTAGRKPRPLCPYCALDIEQHVGVSNDDFMRRRALLEHRHQGGPTRTAELLKLSEPAFL